MNCCQPTQFDQVFDKKLATRELKQLKRRGPKKSTRILIDGLKKLLPPADKSLLDIGGGVGAIPFDLLEDGLASVTNVDASLAYQTLVQDEAASRNHGKKFEFHLGDFVALAEGIKMNDVVTLDRVLCCYEDMSALVNRSVEKARRIYAVVYPRSVWWNRIFFSLANLSLMIMRKDFRTYVHDSEEVEDIVRSNGFEKRLHKNLLIWQIAVYERSI